MISKGGILKSFMTFNIVSCRPVIRIVEGNRIVILQSKLYNVLCLLWNLSQKKENLDNKLNHYSTTDQENHSGKGLKCSLYYQWSNNVTSTLKIIILTTPIFSLSWVMETSSHIDIPLWSLTIVINMHKLLQDRKS